MSGKVVLEMLEDRPERLLPRMRRARYCDRRREAQATGRAHRPALSRRGAAGGLRPLILRCTADADEGPWIVVLRRPARRAPSVPPPSEPPRRHLRHARVDPRPERPARALWPTIRATPTNGGSGGRKGPPVDDESDA